MARFEFGKGRKKQYWDIQQFGRVLRSHDSGGPSELLPGYRTFADESSAAAELGRLISERIEKGFAASDEEARKWVAALARPHQPTAQAPTLPLRSDVYVYNEATGFMVTSMSMAGVALDEGSKKWNKAVADGKMIPVTLFQDDSFVVRVVAGAPLNSQEAEEWVARLEWHLNIPDGKLAITGGAVLVNDEYDADDPYFESYVGVVEVPPGRYRATIYSYAPGVNGNAVLDSLAGGYGKAEPYGQWFRRTRPGEKFPAWLHEWCALDPRTDPGHEEEWKSAGRKEKSELPEYVNFLVHLEAEGVARQGEKPVLVEGWFGEAEGARRPEKCPIGLEARDVVGREKDTAESPWIYVQEIHQKASRFVTTPIEGGAVEVSAKEVCHAYRLAWFSHSLSVPELRVTLPEGGAFGPRDWPAQSLALQQDRALRIAFSNNLKPIEIISLLAESGRHFAALPDGTELELSCSQVDPRTLECERPIGLHRYCGRIVKGQWLIEASFPKVSAATLRSALELSAEIAAGEAVQIKSPEEAKSVLKFAEGNFKIWIEDNPGQINEGNLKLEKSDPSVLGLYGKAVFAVRFRSTWPVLDMSGDDEEEKAKKPSQSAPVQGRKILETPGGRMYFATTALQVDEKLAGMIQKEEPALQSLGYKHVGDLVCNLFPKIAVRSYAREDGDTWATFLIAAPSTLVFELSTRFQKEEASHLTTRNPGAKDDVPKHTYRQSVPSGELASMHQQHEARKKELSAHYGATVKTEPTLESLAAAIEAALKKQLGG